MEAIREVLAVERAWVQAHRDLDLAVIDDILAEDYFQIQSGGTIIGREELLSSYASGRRRWMFAHGDEYEVRLLGETAVLTGRWTGQGTNHGKAFHYQARFMAVYVYRDGRWQ